MTSKNKQGKKERATDYTLEVKLQSTIMTAHIAWERWWTPREPNRLPVNNTDNKLIACRSALCCGQRSASGLPGLNTTAALLFFFTLGETHNKLKVCHGRYMEKWKSMSRVKKRLLERIHGGEKTPRRAACSLGRAVVFHLCVMAVFRSLFFIDYVKRSL